MKSSLVLAVFHGGGGVENSSGCYLVKLQFIEDKAR